MKYPKFLLLFITFIAAYILFSQQHTLPFTNLLLSWGYIGIFLVGILFSYSFTAAPSTSFFLILSKEQNIFLAGIIGGLGALLGDWVIFKFVRYSFADEIEKLQKERLFNSINHRIPKLIKRYIVPIIAAIIIASPLPDEIGVSLMAAATRMSIKSFSVLSFILNSFGIFFILAIGARL